ncbi:hypothetical protein HanPI659440_Chr03g0111401 [Helianthus annuus]|uniref:Uncharacterized protein n=1 Tax=Helianthus annuus TaxID=4232 RepID=A0A251V5N6_HELAN|nr:hypothetical protein HanXRQr2_Chr03g0105181 [Helianthus annuus]KAJ0592659.1 hypothetical protein HanHA300_Chr03g0087681 [Helianthus annuus]KAJ0600278.1 hypothetical protein HanIR_Chr03g0114741 [Helianthus annuus]KAJ0607657.1 hypothetical protein HanHA89_Chr03g0099281 [Helianthus annuus]KAJ0767721.1 hypothetical protein HanLR1_Chr03g0092641 [Helianthus annuus]
MASSFLYHSLDTLISTPASSTAILLFHSDIQNTQGRSRFQPLNFVFFNTNSVVHLAETNRVQTLAKRNRFARSDSGCGKH